MINIFSLQAYQKTVFLQIFFDVVAIMLLIVSFYLMFRYNENNAVYGWCFVIFYTIIRIIYLVIILIKILFLKQFKLLFSFIFSIFFTFLLLCANFMAIPAVSVGEPPTKHIYKQK